MENLDLDEFIPIAPKEGRSYDKVSEDPILNYLMIGVMLFGVLTAYTYWGL